MTVRQFDEAMTLLQEHNPVAHDYLDAIDHKCWVSTGFYDRVSFIWTEQARYAQCKEPNDSSGNRGSYIRTYGVRCNNNTESENARLRHNLSRSSDPLRFFQILAERWMEILQKLYHTHNPPPGQEPSLFLCKKVLQEHEKACTASTRCVVSDTVGNEGVTTVTVRTAQSNKVMSIVSLGKRQCRPCWQWEQTGRACMHAIAVYNKIHKGKTSGKELITSLYDKIWLGDTMHAAFQHEDFEIGQSIPHQDDIRFPRNDDTKLDPPPCKAKRAGRPKGRIPNKGLSEKKRHGSSKKSSLPASSMTDDDIANTNGHSDPPPKRQRCCGNCGEVGHNKRTCKKIDTGNNEAQEENAPHVANHNPSTGVDFLNAELNVQEAAGMSQDSEEGEDLGEPGPSNLSRRLDTNVRCEYLKRWIGTEQYSRKVVMEYITQKRGFVISQSTLSNEDVRVLQHGEWVRDEAINAFLQLLIIREMEYRRMRGAQAEDGEGNNFIVSTFFFTRLRLYHELAKVAIDYHIPFILM